MTLKELIKLAKEREVSITGLAFEMWDYLDPNAQRALGKELCALYNDNEEHMLLENLNEYYPELVLPEELEVAIKDLDINTEEDIEEALSDYLSNEYGYCHLGYEYDFKGEVIHVYNIKWDID